MLKNLNSNQLVLIGFAAVILLVAAFSLVLLQDPSAPLPFSLAHATSSPTPPFPTNTLAIQASDTPIPTRQTSYTPFATNLTPADLTPLSSSGSGTVTPILSQTTQPGNLTPSPSSTRSSSPQPSNTAAFTLTSTGSAITASPTVTSTLGAGETGVTGRIVRNATPVANVTVEFKDDIAPRRSPTNPSGHYWFITLAPDAAFYLSFRLSDNPQLTPPADIASLAKIEGNLPTGVEIIELPDLELSINQDGSLFELQTPNDGAAYSASVIGQSNKLQFIWSSYTTGVNYRVELGPNGNDQPIWISPSLNQTDYMWDGTLSNGTHISEGNYWWRVAATKSVNGYLISIFTHPWDLIFNP